jgi:hypothetical protein
MLAVGVPIRYGRHDGACGMTAPIAHVVLQGADRGGTWSARVVTAVGFVAAAYVITVVTANWASPHWSALVLGSLVIPAGTLWAGIAFTVRDLLHCARCPKADRVVIAVVFRRGYEVSPDTVRVSGLSSADAVRAGGVPPVPSRPPPR